ncbi:cytochrome c oxidase accessory protein FixG [Allopseudospirillum japonicum]|uniref:Cytochrome c oxidase accessory protein FixG n=1 Tax=Allopseudospirillum japonicum TaxID=64971 RepID=A0A1H6THV3_9GAMM|nr:cytochrome c oxidase accessory protein CcoG [Allopseudospirillum japonicum]SEI78876.1 cytochrome c oxidase accessory protein FixG [Allopseudospirillum japonicum]
MTDKIPTQDITPDPGQAVDATKAQAASQTDNEASGSLYAKRKHIYVRLVKGVFQKLRTRSNWLLLLGYFFAAWIQWDGRQAILFDLPNRQFHIFGITFFPHDFMLLAWLLIISAFALFFITNFAGRVWCGYACPQSVWTWLFIWIEDKTEGSRNQRIKLDQQPMDKTKLKRKASKHALWLLAALLTAIAFVGYFSPIRELLPRILSFDLGPWEAWWLGFFTLFTYLNAGWLREQVCIYMCPYARFQSVMFDQDTLIVSYDPRRGEPRGARKKSIDPKTAGLGDCIDCNLCVHVCPVGIDIRDGLQYECITCAACIDACDTVMEQMGYQKGLISYTTEQELEGNTTKLLRPRLIGYFAVLMGMIIAFMIALGGRVPMEVEVLRDRNQLFRETAEGFIENNYTIKIANMDQKPHTYALSVSGVEGLRIQGKHQVTLEAGEVLNLPIQLVVDPKDLQAPSYDVLVQVASVDDTSIYSEKETRFISEVRR